MDHMIHRKCINWFICGQWQPIPSFMAVKYLVDPIDSDARRSLALSTGAAITDAAAVFADPDVDGVIIASSTDTHADLLLQAARAGKAVFC